MKKFTYLLFCLFIGIGLATAQTTSITGTVISADDGEPVIGASVVVKGTTIGTVTDLDGKFSIGNVPSSAKTLVISYVGMEQQEVNIAPTVRVILSSNSLLMDEVLVVAYGTAKKSTFTGSATAISNEKIGKIQTSNVTNALAGQVAGVQMLKNNGQPGSSSTIRIRGIRSINASNDPLYVVDGVPYDGDISAINTQDIESLTILKDASAGALYGARGGNGVVIITTKQGMNQEARITVDAKWGTNRRGVPNYDVMKDPGMYYETAYQSIFNGRYNGSNFAEAHNYANNTLFTNAGGGVGYKVYTTPDGEALIGQNGKLNPNATLGYKDDKFYYLPDNWSDEIFDNGNLREEYNISMTGGKDGLSYYSSLGYLNDSGIIPGSGFSRYSARLKTDYQMKKWLKVGFNAAFTHYDSGNPGDQDGSSSSANMFYVANLIAPIYPLYVRNPDGSIKTDNYGYTVYDFGDKTSTNFTRTFMNMSNPASLLELDKTENSNNIFNGQVYAEIDIIDGLKAKVSYTYHADDNRYRRLYNAHYGQYSAVGGIVYVNNIRRTTMNQQYLLTYHKNLNQMHGLDFMVGFENYDYKYQTASAKREKLFNPDIVEVSNGISSPSASSATSNYATQGVFGRLQYDYDEKYFGSVSYRRDASSRFHPDNRWGNFWSVGGGWALNRESFLEHIEWIDLLKAKISYGEQGNDGLGNYYPYVDQYSVVDNNGEFATTLSYKGNKDITWETSQNFNVGIDFGLFNGRFNGTIEYFNITTKDMLYYMPTPPSLGYSSYPMNVGNMRNRGIEFDLSGTVIKQRDLNWMVNLNMTHLKNKITKLEESLEGEWISGSYIYREGDPINQFYIRKYAGVDDNGNAMWYKDVTDDKGNITDVETTTSYSAGTQYAMGNSLPTVYGGFSTLLEWKGFDLNILFAYQLGGKIYDNTYASLMHAGGASSAGRNWHVDILNAWTPENTQTDVPMLSTTTDAQYASSTSDRFLISSNYLSLQNITLGYTLPRRFTQKMFISSIRVYGVADNVALWSKRRGLDPRQTYTTSSNANYSIIRSISGGISVTF